MSTLVSSYADGSSFSGVFTYNNGTAGVGATLTMNSANTPLIMDGETVVLNNPVVFFGLSSSVQNGIYVLTTQAAPGIAAVLTRSTFFDTPTKINSYGLIGVIGGLTNWGIVGYVQNAVTTIGTDNIIILPFISQSFHISNQVFTSSGTYIPTANMVYCVVRAVAGGGGSGGCTSGSGQSSVGGPGSSGSYGEGLYRYDVIGASQTVTIGSGGAAGATGNNAGGAGGATTLGSLLTTVGGTAGQGGPPQGAPTIITPNAPAAAGTGGTLNLAGLGGGGGLVLSTSLVVSGAGGTSPFGSGGTSQGDGGGAGTGIAGFGYGAGASGGLSVGANNGTGAAGSPGYMIIQEFIAI